MMAGLFLSSVALVTISGCGGTPTQAKTIPTPTFTTQIVTSVTPTVTMSSTPTVTMTSTPVFTATSTMTITPTVTATPDDDIYYVISGAAGSPFVDYSCIVGYSGSTPILSGTGVGAIPLTIGGPFTSFSAGDSVSITAYYSSAVTQSLTVTAYRSNDGTFNGTSLGSGSSLTGESSDPAMFSAQLTN